MEGGSAAFYFGQVLVRHLLCFGDAPLVVGEEGADIVIQRATVISGFGVEVLDLVGEESTRWFFGDHC